MKAIKIILALNLLLILNSCTKNRHIRDHVNPTTIYQNNSSMKVIITFTDNYKSETMTLNPNETESVTNYSESPEAIHTSSGIQVTKIKFLSQPIAKQIIYNHSNSAYKDIFDFDNYVYTPVGSVYTITDEHYQRAN